MLLMRSLLLGTTLASLLAMGPITCKDGPIKYKYDFVIVGGGSAGSVLASRLSENPSISVLLLEAGKDDTTGPYKSSMEMPRIWTSLFSQRDILWIYKSVEQSNLNQRTQYLLGGKVLGGSSSVNGMVYLRGSKADYDYWDHQGARGWNYSEVMPYFLKSEDNHIKEYQNPEHHSTCGPLSITRGHVKERNESVYNLVKHGAMELNIPEVDCNSPTNLGFCVLPKSVYEGKRESASRAYLRPVLERPNLRILTEAFVTKVFISKKNRRAFKVQFQYKGNKIYVRARMETIISAGALSTPKLLLLSGVGPRAHVLQHKKMNFADLPVGQGLQDHIGFTIDILLDMKTQTLQDLFEPDVVSEYLFQKKGLLAETIVDVNIFVDAKRQSTDNWPELSLFFANGRAENNISKLTEDSFKMKFSAPDNVQHGITVIVILLHPKSRGTVKLQSKSVDAIPIIDPQYLTEREDIENLIKGLRKVQRLITTTPFRNVNATLQPAVPECLKEGAEDSDKYWECYIRQKAKSYLHYTGTCRMGDVDDPETVVDNHLRVKGIKDLRVVDASVMPEITSGNTNGPVIMIAEKAADLILEEWKTAITAIGELLTNQ